MLLSESQNFPHFRESKGSLSCWIRGYHWLQRVYSLPGCNSMQETRTNQMASKACFAYSSTFNQNIRFSDLHVIRCQRLTLIIHSHVYKSIQWNSVSFITLITWCTFLYYDFLNIRIHFKGMHPFHDSL